MDNVPDHTILLDGVSEPLREMAEEQEGKLPLLEKKFLGLVNGADQGGKPELFILITLDMTLAEVRARADEKRSALSPGELSEKLGRPFLAGDLVAKILSRGTGDVLSPAIVPIGGDEEAFGDLRAVAFHPNCNQILSAGILCMLKSGSSI
jgi:hypothetical protein